MVIISSRSSPWMILRKRIIARIQALSEAAFWEVDAFAWVQAWQIRRRWHTHTYRDPRFDALISCTACAGTGRGCRRCGETGRIDLMEPIRALDRRPQGRGLSGKGTGGQGDIQVERARVAGDDEASEGDGSS
jgi:hypothetical protein